MSTHILTSSYSQLIETPEYQLHIKQMELNSLLEVTQAINNNLPEAALYKIYHFILRSNLQIQKLLLCIRQEQWEAKASFGTPTHFREVHDSLSDLNVREVTFLSDIEVPDIFQEFDVLIPIFHKDSVLAYVFLNQAINETGVATDTKFIQTLTNLIVVAIENKKLAARQIEQEALNRELQIAKRVQSRLFPKHLPDSAAITVTADYLPHQSVSGDYYDFITLPDEKYVVCIADVSGKGIPAALLMSNFQASLRILVRQTTDLRTIASEINRSLYEVLAGERFVTSFFALYDRPNRRLSYINAGHNPPLIARADGSVQWLKSGTTILGTFEELPFINGETIEDITDFLLFSYTDGVVEAKNKEEEEFGEDRIYESIQKGMHQPPTLLHSQLIDKLNNFRGSEPFTDDVTLLTMRIQSAAS